MNIPGMSLVRRIEGAVNSIPVPMTRQRLGLAKLLKDTFKEMGEDHVGAFAGSLTYSIVFAILPFLTFLTSMFGLFGSPKYVNDTLLPQFLPLLPETAQAFVASLVRGLVTRAQDSTLSVGAIISILVSLYGASGAFRAIMGAMNVMYEVEERRPIWKRYLIAIGLALSVILLLVAAVFMAVFGPPVIGWIADQVGLGGVFTAISTFLRWPILALFVLLAFALVYYYAPDAEQSFKFLTPGSFIALLLWLIFTGLFGLYARNADFSGYGTIAGAIVLMLYIYWSSFILLLGAEMNQIIEAHAPGGKDPGEKEPGQHEAQQAAT